VRAGLAESNGVFQRGEDSPVKSSTALTEAFFFTEKKKTLPPQPVPAAVQRQVTHG